MSVLTMMSAPDNNILINPFLRVCVREVDCTKTKRTRPKVIFETGAIIALAVPLKLQKNLPLRVHQLLCLNAATRVNLLPFRGSATGLEVIGLVVRQISDSQQPSDSLRSAFPTVFVIAFIFQLSIISFISRAKLPVNWFPVKNSSLFFHIVFSFTISQTVSTSSRTVKRTSKPEKAKP